MSAEYVLSPLLVAIVAGILLGITRWQRRQGSAHTTFRWILLCTILWGMLIFFMRSSPDPKTALSWDRPAGLALFTTFLLYYRFSLHIGKARPRTLLLTLGYLSLMAMVALTPTDLMVRSLELTDSGYFPVMGPALYAVMPFSFVIYGAAVRNLVLSRRFSTNAEEKNRLLYVTIGMAFPFIGSVLDVLPTPYPLGMLGGLAFCLITCFAMLKYHLLDIRIVLRKGLAYALCTGLAIGLYAVVFILAYSALAQTFQTSLWLSGGVIVLCSVGFQPILRRAQDWVDRVLYRERYDYLRALERFAAETRPSLDWGSITSSFLDTVTAAMRCGKATLLLADTSGRYFTPAAILGLEFSRPIRLDTESILTRFLARHDGVLTRRDVEIVPDLEAVTADEMAMLDEMEADALVPLVTRDGLRGVLVLGPKLSEQSYSLEEASMLRVVAQQMATALDNARLYVSDKLTGLYNRAFCEEEMRRLDVERQLPISVIMGDLNGLKLVNDALGHEEGDSLLRETAQVLKSCCRKEDIVARWGGDEFVILLPQTAHQDAMTVSARIRRACGQSRTSSIRLSIALGAATKDGPTQDLQDLVRQAEERMYRNKLMERTSSRHDILSSLEQSLRETSHETEEHASRMQELTREVGAALGLSDSQLDELALLSALHDIGKIAIPRTTLEKPGKLSPAEWEIVKKHPEIGYRIAMSITSLAPIAESILAHHERWDGSGYPQGLGGEAIPLGARIVALVDAYDVMITGRVYRQPLHPREAQEEIRRCAGTQFDPRMAEVFLEAVLQSQARALVASVEEGTESGMGELPVAGGRDSRVALPSGRRGASEPGPRRPLLEPALALE